MSGKKTISGLLPAGFRDMLPPSAEFEARLGSIILGQMADFGYQQVSPPVLEFETTLLAGKEEDLKHQTFRMMDPLSRQMLALRADITIQVARMASTRLKDEARPLRLSYTGNVFRVQGEGLHAERQLRQVGAELIGSESTSADAEVVMVAILSLAQVGFKKLSVDFSLPGLAPAILTGSGLGKTARRQLLEKIERKDMAAIKKLADQPTAQLLESVMRSAGEAKSCLAALRKLTLSASGAAMVEKLAEVIRLLETQMGPKLGLTIDPLERRGFEYHTGSTFSFFSAESMEELGRGGRYRIGNEDAAEEAVGFSLLINTLQRNLKTPAPRKRVWVEKGTPLSTILGLQDKGYATVLATESGLGRKEAARLGCGFHFAKGKLSRIQAG
jgi:ATP phosphoribosyltransferase regulatory subunit